MHPRRLVLSGAIKTFAIFLYSHHESFHQRIRRPHHLRTFTSSPSSTPADSSNTPPQCRAPFPSASPPSPASTSPGRDPDAAAGTDGLPFPSGLALAVRPLRND